MVSWWFHNFDRDFRVLTKDGFFVYLTYLFVASIACSLVLRWATSDSYDLPSFKNKKRLHFGSCDFGGSASSSYVRVP